MQDNKPKGITGLSFEQLKSLNPEEQKEIFNRPKVLRGKAKVVNFASVYGAGAPKIATTARIPISEAKLS